MSTKTKPDLDFIQNYYPNVDPQNISYDQQKKSIENNNNDISDSQIEDQKYEKTIKTIIICFGVIYLIIIIYIIFAYLNSYFPFDKYKRDDNSVLKIAPIIKT